MKLVLCTGLCAFHFSVTIWGRNTSRPDDQRCTNFWTCNVVLVITVIALYVTKKQKMCQLLCPKDFSVELDYIESCLNRIGAESVVMQRVSIRLCLSP